PPGPPSRSARPAHQPVDRPSLFLAGPDLERSPASPLGFLQTQDASWDQPLEPRHCGNHDLSDPAGAEDPGLVQQCPCTAPAEPTLFELTGDRDPVDQDQPLRVRPAPLDPDHTVRSRQEPSP